MTLLESHVARQFDRLPPHSIETEMCLLASMMLDKDVATTVMTAVTRDDFFQVDHQIIFDVVAKMYRGEQPVDAILVSQELSRRQLLEEVGGVRYLRDILNTVPSAAHGAHYAGIVREKAVLRRVISASNDALREAYAPQDGKACEVARKYADAFAMIATAGTTDAFRRIGDVVMDLIGAKEKNETRRIPTGLAALDNAAGGLPIGRFTLVGGRPGSGKSLLCKQFLHNIGARGEPIGLVTIEESAEKVAENALANYASVENNHIAYNRLNAGEWKDIIRVTPDLARLDFWVDDQPTRLSDVESAVTTAAVKHGCRVVVVDYLQLIDPDTPSDNENREITKISKTLKAAAKRLDIALVAACQLNRGNETGTIRKPTLRDLRGSGCLDGDTLIAMADGSRLPIRSLVGHQPFNVLAMDPETLKVVTATANNAFCTGRKQTYEMITRSGRRITATGNHRFFTLDGWRELAELVPGDCIATPRILPEPSLAWADMSPGRAALLGLLIGDGCTLPDHVIQYTTNEENLAILAERLAIQEFGDEIRPRIHHERTWIQVYLPTTIQRTHGRSNPIAAWLRGMGIFGLRSYEKRVPEALHRAPYPVVAEFLRHLWATDGSVGKLVTYYATSSRALAEGVQSLLLRFGINALVSAISQGAKGRTQFHVTVSGGPDIIAFAEHIGVAGTRKSALIQAMAGSLRQSVHNTNRDVVPAGVWQKEFRPAMSDAGLTIRQFHKLMGTHHGSQNYKRGTSRTRLRRVDEITESGRIMRLAESDLYWDKIVAIVPVGEREVFDLTVPGPSNFIANNIVAHNSLEQDGDMILLLHREDYYHYQEQGYVPTQQLEIIVAKNKDGCQAVIPAHFSGRHQRVSNWDTPDPF